jgi:hypothetical protein
MKEMIKRKDGSVSQRGLWDNIRAAKGSGKKPTPQMLKQEKKIVKAAKKTEPKKGNVGTHTMPDGKVMKGATHKNKKK